MSLVELSRLVAREHQLAAEGPAEELGPVQDALIATLAALPPQLDPSERALLQQAFTLRERTIAMLKASRDEAAAELQRLGQGRTTVRAYVPAGALPGRSVDHSA